MTYFILAIINDLGECYTEPYKTIANADRALHVLRSYGWIVNLHEVSGNAPSGAI